MSKHKSTDYKLTAVKYYLKGKSSLDEVCHIFNCSKKSLYRWVKKYKLIKTLQRQNPKPYKKADILVHGALICKKCNAVWNRDVNGATNIFRIVKNMIQKKERPKYLCR